MDDYQALAPLTAQSAPTPPEQANALLTRFRGHRYRSWSDPEALECLTLIAQGHSREYAAQEAGIPVSAAYGHDGPASQALAEAIQVIYAQEGAAHYEEIVRKGALGEHDPKAAQYVRMALELRGRLGQRAQASASATVVVRIDGPAAYNGRPLTTIEGQASATDQAPAPEATDPHPPPPGAGSGQREQR